MKKPSKPPKKKERELEEWLVILFVLGIGLFLIWTGVTNLNFLITALGAAFAGASILGTPELRLYLKLTINRVSGNRITHRDVSDSAVIGGDVHGDVIINPGANPLPVEKKEPESIKPEPSESGTTVLVDEAVVIQPNDTKEYKIVLKREQLVTIHAGADYPITVELISQTEILKSDQRHRKTIDVERSRSSVKNANIEYEAKRNGTWFVHVHNDQRKLPLEVGVVISIE